MANIVNNLGQVLLGFRSPVAAAPVTSSLLTSLFGVWNADTATTTLATGAYGAWNGEGSVTQAQLQTSVFSAWNAETSGAYLDSALTNYWSLNNTATASVGGSNGTWVGTANYTTITDGTVSLPNAAHGLADRYISLPDNSLKLTGTFSVSGYYNLSTGGNHTIISSEGSSSTGYNNGWDVSVYSGVLTFTITNAGTSKTVTLNSAAGLGFIYQFTAVYSPGVGIYLYARNKSQSVNLSAFTSTNMTIGYESTQKAALMAFRYGTSSASYQLYGYIGGINIFNKALDSADVEALYNLGAFTTYPYSSLTLPSPKDIVGTNDGTLMNGCTFTTGKVSQAFTFDGVNDYISLPTNSMNFAGDYSISAWVYIPSSYIGTSEIVILCNEYTASYFNNPYGWYLLTIGNSIYHETHVGTNTTTNLIGSYTFTTSAWHHIVYTRKSSTRSRIYVNGNLINSDTNTINPVYSSTHNPTIGAEYLNGAIHDITVANARIDALTTWSREITSDEVSALYNSASGNQYPFSSVTIGGSNDSVSTNNGTVVGGVTYSTGVIGNAFSFNGTTGYVSLPNNSLNISSDFSVSAWINISALSSSQDIISTYTNSGSNNYGWDLWGANSVLKFSVYNGTTSQVDLTYSGLTTNTWIHVVVTRKVSTGTKMYVNGSLVSSNSSTTNPVYLGTNNADLGGCYI